MTTSELAIDETVRMLSGEKINDSAQDRKMSDASLIMDFHKFAQIMGSRVEDGLLGNDEVSCFIERLSTLILQNDEPHLRPDYTFGIVVTLAVDMFGQERAAKIFTMDPSEIAQVFTAEPNV